MATEDPKPKRIFRRPKCCWCIVVAVALLVVVGGYVITWAVTASKQQHHQGFVRVSPEGRFDLDGRAFYWAGWNTHDLSVVPTINPPAHATRGGKTGREIVKELFDDAARNHLSVLRVWATNVQGERKMQVAPDKYDEAVLDGLDYTLYLAKMYDIKVLLVLIDNWSSVPQYLDWSPTVASLDALDTHIPKDPVTGDVDYNLVTDKQKRLLAERQALFFSDPHTWDLYAKHVHRILNRRNKYTHRVYKDDPAIFGFNLINEPRCETWAVPDCEELLHRWLEKAAAAFRQIDDKHLLSIGSEGFFSYEDRVPVAWQKEGQWMAQMGQRFIRNHLIKGIDFATVHAWPKRWGIADPDMTFTSTWLTQHVQVANERLKMPVVLEEFGHPVLNWASATEICEGGAWNQLISWLVSAYFLTESSKTNCNRHLPPDQLALTQQLMNATYARIEEVMLRPELAYKVGGSQVWRIDARVQASYTPATFDVNPYDTGLWEEMGRHAGMMHRVSHSPSVAEGIPCWVGQKDGGMRSCIQRESVCTERRESDPTAGQVIDGEERGPLIFSSWLSCCAPGTGAFDDGCSFGSRVFYH